MSHLADFVYAPKGGKKRVSHILHIGDSPNKWCTALCGTAPSLGALWMGTGSQGEIDLALSLPVHKICLDAARDCGYDLGVHNLPEPDPFAFTIITAKGDVDLIVVQRILAGTVCPATPAERSYIIEKLVEDIEAHPAEQSKQFKHGFDPRVSMAAQGLGVTPVIIRRDVETRRRVLNRRSQWAAV